MGTDRRLNMAYVEFKYCKDCKETTNHINHKCVLCSNREYRQKIAAWKALTVEEKLLDLLDRVETLENKDIKY